MKQYASQPFSEHYIIQLPRSVKDDKELNWTDRIAYWFFVHYEGDNERVLEELEITNRRFQYIKSRLASRGHITRIEERGQVKYMPLDLDTAYWLKIQHLRAASKVGFKQIPDNNIFSLKKYHTLPHILHVLEVLEFTYRIGNQKINKPHHLLARSCKTGVTPHADYVPGFWERDFEEKPVEIKSGPIKEPLQDYTDTREGLKRIQQIRRKLEGNT